MSKNLKNLTLLSLGAALLISSGFIIGGQLIANKTKEDITAKNNELVDTESDVSFNVEDVAKEESDEEDEEDSVTSDADKKASDSKENKENIQTVTNAVPSYNNVKVPITIVDSKASSSNDNKGASTGDNKNTNNRPICSVDPPTFGKIRNTILNNDSNYINDLKNKYETAVDVLSAGMREADQDTVDAFKVGWGMDVSGCYEAFVYQTAYEDGEPILNYIVNLDSGKVYCIPNQGNMNAYEIKDNKVVQSYTYKNGGESYNWR